MRTKPLLEAPAACAEAPGVGASGSVKNAAPIDQLGKASCYRLESLFQSGLPYDSAMQNILADQLWILVSAALVFMMQAGFLCVEVGCIGPQAATVTALKNVVDWVICAIVFYALGWGLMFAPSSHGLFGEGFLMLEGELGGRTRLAFHLHFLFQIVFAGTSATIVSGALAGRTGFAAYMLVSCVVTGLIYPVLGHWCWGASFFGDNQPLLARMGFVDFAGSTVVHSVGGWVSLVGVWFVGARLGRFDEKTGKPRELAQTGMHFTALGVLILWVAWWGFNGGSVGALNDKLGPVIINTNLAGATGGLAGMFYAWKFQKRAQLTPAFLNGILSGLVGVTASCHMVSGLSAIAIGATAGVITCLVGDALLALRLDDPVGAIPVHLGAGVWGTLCVALFGDSGAFPLRHTRLEQVGVQLMGVGACALWCLLISVVCFAAIKRWVGLRVSPREELEGYDIGGAVGVPGDHTEFDEAQLKELFGRPK